MTLEEQFDQATEIIGDNWIIGPAITDCWNKVNDTNICLPGVDHGKVLDRIGTVDLAWDRYDDIKPLLLPGDPFWFLGAASKWLDVADTVKTHIVSLTALQATRLPAVTSWSTPDGSVYRSMPAAQATAIEDISTFATDLSSKLDTHGRSLIESWIKIGEASLDCQQKVSETRDTFLTANPNQWLDLIQTINSAVVKLLIRLSLQIAVIKARWQDTSGQLAELSVGSAGGKWPTV